MPLSLVFLLQLVALSLWSRQRKRAAAATSITGLLLLLLACNEGIADRTLQSLESRHAPLPDGLTQALPAPAPDARYILILGGGHFDTDAMAPTNRLANASLGRLVEGVRLARLLPNTQLLTCGPVPTHGHESHAHVLARAAISLGIDPARITELAEVHDTHDEVHAAQAIIGDAPVLLVTSAWHMPRALGLAHAAGLNATPAPADFVAEPQQHRLSAWFTFSVWGLQRNTLASREYLGLAWTALRGQR